jgi:TolA-binding protein
MLLILGVAACSLFGQKKEYMELQREVALFGDQLRTLQRSFEEKLAQLSQQLQQAAEAANKTNASVADLDRRVGEQSKNLTAPVAGIGAKVDQMAGDFQSSLNARLGKMEQQLLDISTAIKTIQSPPVAPPSAPAMSAEMLFQNATRDREGGSLELALKEFSDYVQVYGATEQAAAAQYYIGDIHYRSERFQEAVAAFDLVLTNYLDSDKAPDAHYMKGMALGELGETAKARSEFDRLIKRFPKNELAAKARVQIRTLATPAKPPRSKSK